MKHWQMW